MDKKTKSETSEKPRRARLSAWSYLADDPALLPGERRLFIGRSQIPFEAERVRVPLGVRVAEVTVDRTAEATVIASPPRRRGGGATP